MPALRIRILLTAAVLLALGGCQGPPEPSPAAPPAAPGSDAGCLVEPPLEPLACTMAWKPVCAGFDRIA